MNQSNKVPTKGKKAPSRKKPEELTDAFTLLCKTELKQVCIKEHRFHPKRKWRFDYAFPAAKVALEVEGGVWTSGRHTRPQGFLNDIEKYNTATLLGWKVLRTTPDELYTKNTLNMLNFAITGAFYTENTPFLPNK